MNIQGPGARQVSAAISTLRTAGASGGKMAQVVARTASARIAEGLSGLGAAGAPGRMVPGLPAGRAPFLYHTPRASDAPLMTVASRVAVTSARLARLASRLAGPGEGSGATRQVDEASLAQKRQEAMEGIADAAIDEAKSNYDEAKEQFKLALRIMSEHMDRMTQVTQKITS